MSRFEGLKDNEWAAVELLIPYRWARGRGNHPLYPRKILNTLVWVLTTGARWCDVPIGEQWASRACAHKYLGLWKVNGLLERVLVALQEICVEAKAIDLTRLAVDGFFSTGKGGGEGVDYGYKGKGVTPILEADKGYDSKELRLQILNLKIFPYIPYRRMGKNKSEPSRKVLEKHRWKVERGIAWLQRKYRRLAVRWERRMKYWEGFLTLGILLYWVKNGLW